MFQKELSYRIKTFVGYARRDRVLLVAVASCRTEVDYARCPDRCLSRRSTPESVRPTRAGRRVPEPLGGLAKPDPNLPRSSEGRGRGTCGRYGHVPLSTRRRNGHPSHPPWPARVPSFDSGERARASWRGDVPRGRHHGGEPTGDRETHRPPQGGSRRVVRGGRHDLTRPPVRFIPGFSLPL